MKRSNVYYILMIAANLVLITLLMAYPMDGVVKKIVQVLIVVVTFTLMRTYLKERQIIGDKKNGEK